MDIAWPDMQVGLMLPIIRTAAWATYFSPAILLQDYNMLIESIGGG